MPRAAVHESGTRNRTRSAILSAAASVFARNRSATLADVAEAAEVGRSTLHRYFADRDELINSVVADSYQAIQQSVVNADVEHGAPLEAMRRLVAGMVELGDRLLFLFGEPRLAEEYIEREPDQPPVVRPVIQLILRGQQDGVFTSEVSAEWIQHVLWSLVYTACEMSGRNMMSRHEATSTVIRTFEHGVVQPAAGD
jgi:AcrR family transcriptional regulator